MLGGHLEVHTRELAGPAACSGPGREAWPCSVVTVRFWSALWTTFRPYLTFVSGAAALVGIAFSEANLARSLLAFVPLFFSYAFGQAITDCFQLDTDALSSPYRPLVQGVVSRAQVISVGGVGLVASAAVLAALNAAILLPAALAVAGLLLYTPLKRTWWGGPPCNAAVVALLPVMGRMGDGLPVTTWLASGDAGAFLAAVMALFLGYGDFVVIGYLKDVSADRATGYRTFPVAFGWRAAVLYGDLLMLGATGGAAYVLVARAAGALAWATLLAAIVFGLRAHGTAHRLREEQEAHRPIVDVVRAFLLLAGAIVLGARPGWAVALAGFYGAFEVAIRRRPERTQV